MHISYADKKDVVMDALNRILDDAEKVIREKGRVVIAIDGKSGTGKSHLSRLIEACAGVSTIHMDDFFLPKEKRTKERYEMAGGNVDSERFIEDVIIPLKRGMPFSYRPFDCSTMSLKNELIEIAKPFIIVEGVYSLHPLFRDVYDMGYVLTAPYSSRIDRIKARSGDDKLEKFISLWMPLEDKYFEAFDFSFYPELSNG